MSKFIGIIGKLIWSVPGCCIRFETNGPEPQFTTHDKIAVLNCSDKNAHIQITCFFEDIDAIGPFKIEIKGKRVRKVRFNDLIDPQAIEMEKTFGCVIVSDIPVVIQYSRMDTGQRENTQMATIAF